MRIKIFLITILLLAALGSSAQVFKGGAGDGAAISCDPPKVSTLTPTDITCAGDTITLAIHALGTEMTYKWQKFKDNFFEDITVDIEDTLIGVGTPSLNLLHPVKEKVDGLYRCIVVNDCDADTSEVFTIKLNAVPTVQTHMGANNSGYAEYACANSANDLKLVSTIFSPEGDHKYSWVRIDTLSGQRVDLPDTTDFCVVGLKAAALEAGGLYIVTASNVCGSVSDSVYLPVYREPTVEWQGVGQSLLVDACEFGNVTLEVKASGGGEFTYTLEQVKWIPGSGAIEGFWETIPGGIIYTGKVAQHIKNNLDASEDGTQYRWTVKNQCGEGVSDVITLKVDLLPEFVSEFPDTVVCESQSVVLRCEPLNNPEKCYWLKDGIEVPGSRGSNELEIPYMTQEQVGKYICVAYNSCGDETQSEIINVTMNPLPVFVRDPYMRQVACMGDTVVHLFTKLDDIIGYDSLRWFYDGNALIENDHWKNTTDENMQIRNITMADYGYYTVKAYNRCGFAESERMNMYKLALPVSFSKELGDSEGALLCAGSEQVLSVATSGTSPIHYKWIVNESVYNTDTNFVVVKGQDISDLNRYLVYAYNMCGSATDSGWINVERFDHFAFTGFGEYCAGEEPNGHLILAGSDTALTYRLMRNPGAVVVETFKGTGSSVEFENMPGGTYYVLGENPATGCVQEMNGRVEVTEKPSPDGAHFYLVKGNCNSTGGGAVFALTGWENDIKYTLQRLQKSSDYQDQQFFVGGDMNFADGSDYNSPVAGEPKFYKELGSGRYRIKAQDVKGNGCVAYLEWPDSVYQQNVPVNQVLKALNNDTVNCNVNDGDYQFAQYKELVVDGFVEGYTYTLYRNGEIDTTRQVDKTSPISWSRIDEGDYHVVVSTSMGCASPTNHVRIRNVDIPRQPQLIGSTDLCDAVLPGTMETLSIPETQEGVIYKLYRKSPAKLMDTQVGKADGSAVSFPQVPAERTTYYVMAYDPTEVCAVKSEDEFTVLASQFQVEANPGEIFLTKKGLTTWLHAEINGNYVKPLDVQWEPDAWLQKGIINQNNSQYHKQYYWPFCPCAGKHEYGGSYGYHGYSHGAGCTALNCPYYYHAWNAGEHGCVYVSTVYRDWKDGRQPYYDLYYCRDQVQDDFQLDIIVPDTLDPFRNVMTTPVYEDRKYSVTVKDGSGCVHSDTVLVRVTGGKLTANIMKSAIHEHYVYPFCPCASYHSGHVCSPSCNDKNCPRLYHAHKHEGYFHRGPHYIPYYGQTTKDYDIYYYPNGEADDYTLAQRLKEQFFFSEISGGDFEYDIKWSFVADPSAATDASFDDTGEHVMFTAKESGWLYLDVTSMKGTMTARDSIWIQVYRTPFTAYIQEATGQDRIDSLYLCKGETSRLYAYHDGGDAEVTDLHWFAEKDNGDLGGLESVEITADQSQHYYLRAINDVTIWDTVYVVVREKPAKPMVENAGIRCVQPRVMETIQVAANTEPGVRYSLMYSPDNTNFEAIKWYDNQGTAAIPFYIDEPTAMPGFYIVRAENMQGDHTCAAYSDTIEFILPPSKDKLLKTEFCKDEQIVLQINEPQEGMSYSILSTAGTLFETITAPKDYFSKTTFGANDYLYVRTRPGLRGSCSDTIPFTISRVKSPELLTDGQLVVNDGNSVCEGEPYTKIQINDAEFGVRYHVAGPTTDTTFLFQGGATRDVTISGQSYGLYVVYGERGQSGCMDQVATFMVNRRPDALEQTDTSYCYPMGTAPELTMINLDYQHLPDQPGWEYTLTKNGKVVSSFVGGGSKSFTNVNSGSYIAIVTDQESGCSRTTSFEVLADKAPYAFTLESDCGMDRTITLFSSEQRARYILYRDAEVLDTLLGTGTQLSFGIYNTSGVYTVWGEDTTTLCGAWMDGSVIITELGHCELEQDGKICSLADISKGTELVYPCSKEGWEYQLREIEPKVANSEWKKGDGTELRWKDCGGLVIAPERFFFTSKPATYILYGRDACDEIPLDTIVIKVEDDVTGDLYAGSVMTSPIEICPKQAIDFTIRNMQKDVNYILMGVKDGNFRDTLVNVVANADVANQFIGSFANYESYYFFKDKDGCPSAKLKQLFVSYLDTVNVMHVTGSSLCDNFGKDIELSLGTPDADQRYILYRDNVPVDTVGPHASGWSFKPQHDVGIYRVIGETLFNSTAPYIAKCRDTMDGIYAIGPVPTTYKADVDTLFLCEGGSGTIELNGGEKNVLYRLVIDGVVQNEILTLEGMGPRPISFNVAPPAPGTYQYIVRAYLSSEYAPGDAGMCEVDMDTVTVMVGTKPNLGLYDTYYYCREEEGGALIEIPDVPNKCTFKLYNAGVNAIAGPVETQVSVKYKDTIRFATPCPEGEIYNYVLTVLTREGCYFEHNFNVELYTPPTRYKVLSSAAAVCEGGTTTVSVVGDQQGVIYTLMKVDPDGDYAYRNNVILGWGDKDTLNFQYPIIDRGKYYVLGTYYARPKCVTLMGENNFGKDTIDLPEYKVIRYNQFDEYELHYCDKDKPKTGATIRLNNAEENMEYRLYRGKEVDMQPLGGQFAAYDGEQLEWKNVFSDGSCTAANSNDVGYRVLAIDPLTKCTKWMDGEVVVYGDGGVKVDALTYNRVEFCEGDNLLIKVRASGCGLDYNWTKNSLSGTTVVTKNESTVPGELLIPKMEAGDEGKYVCTIANQCGDADTKPAVVVIARPKVKRVQDIKEQTICEGGSDIIYSNFENVSSGDFRWHRLGETQILSREAYLELTDIRQEDEGYYICVAGDTTKGYCNEMADTIWVDVVLNVDSLRVAMKRDTLCAGDMLRLDVTAQVPSEYDVEWYHNGEPLFESGHTFEKNNILVSEAGIYAMSVETGCGQPGLIPVSKVAVDTAIEVVWHTPAQNLCYARNVLLQVKTNPSERVSYEWVYNGTEPIEGGDQWQVTVRPEGTGSTTCSYRVYYWNKCPAPADGSNSVEIPIHIETQVKFNTDLPDQLDWCQNAPPAVSDRTLEVDVDGGGLTIEGYKWLFQPADSLTPQVLEGVTGNQYVVPNTKAASGIYTCLVQMGECGQFTSNACLVRVDSLPDVTTSLKDMDKMCEGADFSAAVTATGDKLVFKWMADYFDGAQDTVRKAIGYRFESTDWLDMKADTKYNGAKLYCIVSNGCGVTSSDTVTLKIEQPRFITIDPATPKFCKGTSVDVSVAFINGDGGDWYYVIQRDNYTPEKVTVPGGTTPVNYTISYAGTYKIIEYGDQTCHYKDVQDIVFNASQYPQANAYLTLEKKTGTSTTICAMTDVQMRVIVNGGTGPFEVSLWQDDGKNAPKLYDGWLYGNNPFTVPASRADTGYIITLSVKDTSDFWIEVSDLNNDGSSACDVYSEGDKIRVNVIKPKNVSWDVLASSANVGACKFDPAFALSSMFKPTPEGGVYHIIRQSRNPVDTIHKNFAVATLSADECPPGKYRIYYSVGSSCDDMTHPFDLVVDSLPYMTITPVENLVCAGMQANYEVKMHGTEPFKSFRRKVKMLGRNGKVENGEWEKLSLIGGKLNYAGAFYLTYNDSIREITTDSLVDKHGCVSAAVNNPIARVYMQSPPKFKVEGLHPNYDNGQWGKTEDYNIDAGDEVEFRITLQTGDLPWQIHLSDGPDCTIANNNTTISVTTARDTVIRLSAPSCYHFNVSEKHGCMSESADEVHKRITNYENGYFSVSGLFLGGPYNKFSGLMVSKLPDLADFPLRGGTLPKAQVAAMGASIVDWIVLEARHLNKIAEFEVVSRDTFLLTNIGMVVDRNGNTELSLPKTGTTGEEYYLVVKHRNHLSVMSAKPYLFGTPGAATYIPFGMKENFYLGEGKYEDHLMDVSYGANSNRWALVPGYVDLNKKGQLVSLSNPNHAYFKAGGLAGATAIYHDLDVNFDGKVDVPGYTSTISGLVNLGTTEDAWILFKNRGCWSEIEDLP